MTSCLTHLDHPVLKIKTKIVGSHTVDSKQVKQEVNGTVIRPPLVFPVNDFGCVSFPDFKLKLKILILCLFEFEFESEIAEIQYRSVSISLS